MNATCPHCGALIDAPAIITVQYHTQPPSRLTIGATRNDVEWALHMMTEHMDKLADST